MVTTKASRQVSLKTFDLVDQTAKVQVSTWWKQAAVNIKPFQIIGIKKAKVSNYGNKSLSVQGYIEFAPQHSMFDALAK